MTVTGILTAIVIGAIIGVLGRLVLPGRQPIGILLTIGVGVLAALVGTAIAQSVGVATTDGIDWIELVFQIGLATAGVAAVAAFQRRNRGVRGH
ncbi:GlsB/YeaQ/YmgE family stress response membrane protein [Spirillospora sp. NPDC047279]|uniref:GlsB/YeaQ/YmgE family stress response membrane protein n=1 Tax=Spirillospora sp. NPDC047279 TaxID=3155478 RepID=UPI0034019EA3